MDGNLMDVDGRAFIGFVALITLDGIFDQDLRLSYHVTQTEGRGLQRSSRY